MKTKCKCGKYLDSMDINLYLNTNEEGEEFTEIIVECEGCGFDHVETSEWGHIEKEEALEILRDDFNLQL